jgi:hypothetical protein
MIGHFPPPYPGELFYSMCARFSERMQYRYPGSVMIELFGTARAWSTIDPPRRLHHLVAALPPGYPCTVDKWIDEHTLLPFYSPFVQPDRFARLREPKASGSPGRAPFIISRHPPMPDRLRFCPLCVQEDRRQFGECYWHRLHQAPGIYVCPVHKTFLESSDVGAHTIREFIPAESCTLQSIQLRPLDLLNPGQRAMLEMACDAAWLLDQGCLASNLETVQNQYINLLIKRGFATSDGRIYDLNNFLQAFNVCYPLEILTLLRCEPGEARRWHWLFGLLRKGQGQPPARHLLLIHFLGHTAETFFNLPAECQYSARPCPQLNLASQPRKEQPADPQICDKYRALWLSAMKDNPTAGRGKLARMLPRVYLWLWSYDREWLNSHKPSCQRRGGAPAGPRLDWKERDTQLAEQVRQSAQRLLNLPGRPVRLTKSAIGRDIGRVELVQKSKLIKLPLTAQALSEVTESYEAFAVRRIQWATNQYHLEKVRPTRGQLPKRSGMHVKVESTQVEKAIEAALESFDGYL